MKKSDFIELEKIASDYDTSLKRVISVFDHYCIRAVHKSYDLHAKKFELSNPLDFDVEYKIVQQQGLKVVDRYFRQQFYFKNKLKGLL